MMSDEQLRAMRQPPKPATELATAPQQRYIGILIEDRLVPQPWLLRIKDLVEQGLTKQKASQIIGALKPLPRSPLAVDNREASPRRLTPDQLPSGRYAIDHGDNEISFYKVKWNETDSFYWLDQIAGPHQTEVKSPAQKEHIVKNIIRAGVGNSAALYGFKIGRCSICHTRITNRLSRELGIGPVCGGRVFADWDTRRNNAETSLRRRGLDPNENIEES